MLYTFDDLNKTNCLARWPQVLDVRTVYLDENTQIGVVELKLCIQAIVSASPELVAKLGQDYTVYAYDYSEYDTPLVGQGMLSWVLASSSAPAASAFSSRTVVTGRVCRNILGLFSSSSQETLEVKLRLVPVPSCLQSEYIESMKTYRDLSKMMPQGFDAAAWTSFLQANPSVGNLTQQNRRPAATNMPVPREVAGLEHPPRIASQGTSRRGSTEQRYIPPKDNPSATEPLQQQPRATSPALSARSATAPSKRRGRPPRASSRTSTQGRDTQPVTISMRDPGESTREPDDDRLEDGPLKKRAKVSRVEWPDTTGFDKQPDSLRVAASTAASVRIHQPTAVRPPVNSAPSLDGPPRAPTPIADPHKTVRRPPLPTARSNLQYQSPVAGNTTYKSPYVGLDAIPKPVGGTMTSPEGRDIGSLPNTPHEIPSSPPVYRGPSTAPSSPHLPTLPAHMDSGFMSGATECLFEDDEYRTPEDNDPEVTTQCSRRPELPEGAKAKINEPHLSAPVSPAVDRMPPNIPTVGQKIQPRSASPEKREKQDARQSETDAEAIARTAEGANSASGSRVLSRTMSSGEPPAPPFPNSDLAQPMVLCRSNTGSGQQESHPESDTAGVSASSETSGKSKQRNKGTGANAKRKKAIQSRLQTSIEAGEMPPFCENCGAIETPTWRKAWVKVHSGKPDLVQISEEDGGIIAWETLQTDVQGSVCLYRIIKRSLLPVDEGFTEILLCNREFPQYLRLDEANAQSACGLWLHTRKCIRPKEVWEKAQKSSEEKRKRAERARMQKSVSTCEKTRSGPSPGQNVHSNASSPVDEAKPDTEFRAPLQVPQPNKPRASSLQPSSGTSTEKLSNQLGVTTLSREVQSSPPRLAGTILAPIEVGDLTPKPTRRILFPSPKQIKDQRALGETSSNPENHSEDVHSKGDHSRQVEYDPSDKENRPPTPNEDPSFDDLFDDNNQPMTRPATPTPTNTTNLELFKTPGNPVTPDRYPPLTGDFFSSAAKVLFHPITPVRTLSTPQQTLPMGELTPFTLVNQILSEANNASPTRVNSFDFAALPSLHNSPSSHTRHDFDFSNFDPQDLLSTDMPIPSSPPWFGVYEDPMEAGGDLWSVFQLPDSPDKRPLTEAEEILGPTLDREAPPGECSAQVEGGGP